MMRPIVMLSLVLLAAAPAGAQSIEVTPLARDGQVLVSFAASAQLTDEARASIQSGLPTHFTYDVELRRASPVWFDRTISAARVTVTVRFDNLTRRYQLSRLVDGRVAESRVIDDESELRRWVTEFERLPLFRTDALRANAEYYIRVRARTKPNNLWFLWPWDRVDALGSGKFTFLP